MLKNVLKRIVKAILVVAIILFISSLMEGCSGNETADQLTVDGKDYVYLDLSQDIFVYDLHNPVEYFEDEIVVIENSPGDMVYCGGDIFCLEEDLEKFTEYYKDDYNYQWFVIIGDSEEMVPVVMTDTVLMALDGIEDEPKETYLFFEELENMATLVKVSRDGFMEGRTEIAEYEGHWYWRTEVINEDVEVDGTWPEYVIKLPDGVI